MFSDFSPNNLALQNYRV
uniref:Uncharacterized protein n=1 Tax=Anguilla anguilla TaxID=7936 RepID=A0A0E9QYE3_ANGAN